jgi:3-deoxy-manno-octulosonate cytidylyltransferase (CMP-KDO synthetase)
MKTLAVIPARLGSTRLPRKPLRLLAGVPLIVRVWQRVLEHDPGDLTCTVEAGLRLSALQELLAASIDCSVPLWYLEP